MTIASRSWRRALGLTVALVAAVGTLVGANPAQAQTPTGASGTKVCAPAITTIGQTVTCFFTVENIGDNAATVVVLTEQSPFPNGPTVNVSCTTAGAVVINTGDTLAAHTPCAGSFQDTIPDDPAICNTFLTDEVTLSLLYPQFSPPLVAGAFATNSETVICPAHITITKTATQLSKVGDSVTYSFQICNVGDATVNRGSVTDTLLGDLTTSFPATLAPGQCVMVQQTRTVAAGDPDPLVNTVTATYTSGSGIFLTTDTKTATASTNLFQPSVGVTKSCAPDPVVVGGVETCTIVVTNTSSADAPALINGTIVDTLTGNLLAANTAVVSSNCTAVLPSGGTCTIVTQRTVLATDPNPLVNTVTVHYNPQGFPNDITAHASASVTVTPPPVVCTLTKGFFRNHPAATAAIIADLGGTLTIGGTALTAAQVQEILNATPGQPGDVTFTSNSLLNLTQQLITALLNLDGAAAPAQVQAAIAAVQAGITITIGAGGQISITTSLSQSQIGSLTETLSSFNEGAFPGFAHCGS
jgi:uncharacterized repeat protein (TIGR01451 family)